MWFIGRYTWYSNLLIPFIIHSHENTTAGGEINMNKIKIKYFGSKHAFIHTLIANHYNQLDCCRIVAVALASSISKWSQGTIIKSLQFRDESLCVNAFLAISQAVYPHLSVIRAVSEITGAESNIFQRELLVT